MSRTIIYIDGYNLYYSRLKGTPYKAAEKFVRGAGEPRWDEILKMAKRYAPTSGSVAMIARFADINQEFTRWKNEP